MSRFNLLDEKWIPVRFPDGTRDELGVSDVLRRSKEIAVIEDTSPLVVAGLHRFLLAVLYRALVGPTDPEQAQRIFDEGLLTNRITAYLDKWRQRFWLFDESNPFGQNPNVSADEIEPWTKLTAEHNATANKVLFDHTDTQAAGARSPGECARWLVATMTFSISGGRGYYPSPSANAMMCIPLGRSLHDTLCYSLVPYSNRDVASGDSAVWEREPDRLPLGAPKRMASGFADLYTWQPRMILLQPLASGDVAAVRFVAGQGFDNPSGLPDPMQAYRKHDEKGKLPVQFREDRGAWRDFASLLPDHGGLAPLTVMNALRLAGRRADKLPAAIMVLGLRYDPPNANLTLWRLERFALPAALAGDRDIRGEIESLLVIAEHTHEALRSACGSFARSLLGRGERKPLDKDIRQFVRQISASPWYWSTLESRFHDVLGEITLELDSEEVRRRWLVAVRGALSEAWERHRISVTSSDAWTIRALVKAEGPVLRKLKQLSEEILSLSPQMEDA
jgi:CRISPR system Cascade subunit CasA